MTETEYKAQLGRPREMLQEHDVDAVLVSNPASFCYLSGFKDMAPQEREAYVLIRPGDGTICGDGVAAT